MRNLMLLLSLLLIANFTSYSQKHQVSGGVGIASSSQIMDAFLEFASIFPFSMYDSPRIVNTQNIGEFRVSYAYTPQERWSFGGTLSYNHSKSDVFYKEREIGKRTNNFITLAGETGFNYLNREKIRLYALVGAGLTYAVISETDHELRETFDSSDGIFNFHVSPIGIQIGQKWGGFAEAGFGYRGLLSAGVFYNL